MLRFCILYAASMVIFFYWNRTIDTPAGPRPVDSTGYWVIAAVLGALPTGVSYSVGFIAVVFQGLFLVVALSGIILMPVIVAVRHSLWLGYVVVSLMFSVVVGPLYCATETGPIHLFAMFIAIFVEFLYTPLINYSMNPDTRAYLTVPNLWTLLIKGLVINIAVHVGMLAATMALPPWRSARAQLHERAGDMMAVLSRNLSSMSEFTRMAGGGGGAGDHGAILGASNGSAMALNGGGAVGASVRGASIRIMGSNGDVRGGAGESVEGPGAAPAPPPLESVHLGWLYADMVAAKDSLQELSRVAMMEPSVRHLGTLSALPDAWTRFADMYVTAEWQLVSIHRLIALSAQSMPRAAAAAAADASDATSRAAKALGGLLGKERRGDTLVTGPRARVLSAELDQAMEDGTLAVRRMAAELFWGSGSDGGGGGGGGGGTNGTLHEERTEEEALELSALPVFTAVSAPLYAPASTSSSAAAPTAAAAAAAATAASATTRPAAGPLAEATEPPEAALPQPPQQQQQAQQQAHQQAQQQTQQQTQQQAQPPGHSRSVSGVPRQSPSPPPQQLHSWSGGARQPPPPPPPLPGQVARSGGSSGGNSSSGHMPRVSSARTIKTISSVLNLAGQAGNMRVEKGRVHPAAAVAFASLARVARRSMAAPWRAELLEVQAHQEQQQEQGFKVPEHVQEQQQQQLRQRRHFVWLEHNPGNEEEHMVGFEGLRRASRGVLAQLSVVSVKNILSQLFLNSGLMQLQMFIKTWLRSSMAALTLPVGILRGGHTHAWRTPLHVYYSIQFVAGVWLLLAASSFWAYYRNWQDTGGHGATWPLMAFLIVLQPTYESTIQKGTMRLICTVVGALLAWAWAEVSTNRAWLVVISTLSVAPAFWLLADARSRFPLPNIADVQYMCVAYTFAYTMTTIFALEPPFGYGPQTAATTRMASQALGCAIAMFLSLVLFPVSGTAAAAAAAIEAATEMEAACRLLQAEVLAPCAAGGGAGGVRRAGARRGGRGGVGGAGGAVGGARNGAGSAGGGKGGGAVVAGGVAGRGGAGMDAGNGAVGAGAGGAGAGGGGSSGSSSSFAGVAGGGGGEGVAGGVNGGVNGGVLGGVNGGVDGGVDEGVTEQPRAADGSGDAGAFESATWSTGHVQGATLQELERAGEELMYDHPIDDVFGSEEGGGDEDLAAAAGASQMSDAARAAQLKTVLARAGAACELMRAPLASLRAYPIGSAINWAVGHVEGEAMFSTLDHLFFVLPQVTKILNRVLLRISMIPLPSAASASTGTAASNGAANADSAAAGKQALPGTEELHRAFRRALAEELGVLADACALWQRRTYAALHGRKRLLPLPHMPVFLRNVAHLRSELISETAKIQGTEAEGDMEAAATTADADNAAVSASQARLAEAALALLTAAVDAGGKDGLDADLKDYLSGRPGGGGSLVAGMDALRITHLMYTAERL
ncbi:hypothetical protein FOA52_008348 [Chlamydomonas sp. UWO 241]|nr:hypothetical protein FOA52_008348 [Chlamydomonas sp. UWO 241]